MPTSPDSRRDRVARAPEAALRRTRKTSGDGVRYSRTRKEAPTPSRRFDHSHRRARRPSELPRSSPTPTPDGVAERRRRRRRPRATAMQVAFTFIPEGGTSRTVPQGGGQPMAIGPWRTFDGVRSRCGEQRREPRGGTSRRGRPPPRPFAAGGGVFDGTITFIMTDGGGHYSAARDVFDFLRARSSGSATLFSFDATSRLLQRHERRPDDGTVLRVSAGLDLRVVIARTPSPSS